MLYNSHSRVSNFFSHFQLFLTRKGKEKGLLLFKLCFRNRKIAGRDSQVNNELVVGSPHDTPGGVPQTSMPHDLVRNSPQPQHNASLRQQQDGHHQHSDYVDHYERVESPALETTLYEDPVNIFNRSVNQAQENQGLQRTPSISVTGKADMSGLQTYEKWSTLISLEQARKWHRVNWILKLMKHRNRKEKAPVDLGVERPPCISDGTFCAGLIPAMSRADLEALLGS